MKEFLNKILVVYLGLAFIFVTFGFWNVWSIIIGIIIGITYNSVA